MNNRRVEGIETRLTPADLASESTMVLRSGKKNYALPAVRVAVFPLADGVAGELRVEYQTF